MIGPPEPSGAPIGPSAVEELVEAALTGAVAVLLWTGLRRMVGAAAPLLWRRAHQLVSGKVGRTTEQEEPSGPDPASASAAAASPVPASAVMCSVAGVCGPPGLSPGADGAAAAAREEQSASDERPVDGMAAFEPASTSYGDGVVIASEDCVNSDAMMQCARVTMSDANVADKSDFAKAPCRTEDVASDIARGDDCEVPEPAEGPMSDVWDEENPCNQTLYSEGDGEDADAETDENTYDLGLNRREQDDEYDDWFAVSNDDEIRTIATADLQPFYGEMGAGEAGRRPTAMFHLAEELDSEPEFGDGYSCLETIVEENSDDMRSDSDSVRSGPASQDWSAGSEGDDGASSPAALAAGPPGWTWCLEPSDSTGAADDWGSEDECEPTPRVRRASAGDEVMELDSLGHSHLLDWVQPLTKSCVGAPLFSDIPPARPLAATTTAGWRYSPELLSQAAPPSQDELRGHHWRVDNEPISAELNCGASGRRHSDPGACGDEAGRLVTLPRPSSATGERPATAGRPMSPQGHLRSPLGPAPTPRVARGGSDGPAIGHDPPTKVLGAARNAQLGASAAERQSVSSCRPGVTSTPTSTSGATGAAELAACGQAAPAADDPKWDLGSCEDFENLDRRIESLTFDFEEEERTLQTLESLASVPDQQRRRYQRLSNSRQVSTEEPEQRCDSVRRFHSSGDLTMIGDDVRPRSDRSTARRGSTKTTQIDSDSNGAPQTTLSAPETTLPRPHARVELLRHSSENLSEDSGFGEQPAGARSSSEASSPPPSLSLSTPREETAGQAETAPSKLSRRSQSTPDLSPSAQRRRRLLELIGRDERRRARVYVDAAASDARDAAPLDAGTPRPATTQRQLSLESAASASPAAVKERPVPAPRVTSAKPAAVYQNVPPNAWLAAQAAGGGGKEASRRTTQVNDSPSPVCDPAPYPPALSGTCSEQQRCGAVAARPMSATRGFARATSDPLDCDEGASDDPVTVRPVTLRLQPELDGPAETGDQAELTAVDARWQAVSDRAMLRACPSTHDAELIGEPRDIYLTEDKPQLSVIHRRAAGRPKPLDIASAQEFLLLEGAEGERFATDAFVFSPDAAAGARHIRTAGPAEGAAHAAAGAAAGAADRPIVAPAAACPAAPGNRRSLSQWDLSTAADGRDEREPAGRVLGGSAHDLSACGDVMAVPRQESSAWGRPEPAVPPAPAAHLSRLHAHGLGYPDWLDTSMEPADTGEASSVGGFFSRVAVAAAPPDTAGLPGLVRGFDNSTAAGGAVRRYGPQSSVEVRINRQGAKSPPTSAGRAKGVQFSPLVSEVRWRETYLDEESTDGRSLSPAWDGREEPGAPPRPPLPAQHADLRPAGPAPASAAASAAASASAAPPQPPPRTDSRPVSARPAETQRLRVSYPVDSGDGGGVRRQVVTCERAANATPPTPPTQSRTDGAEMERRRNGSLTTPPAAPRAAAAEKPRTMMERLGLGRLSGSRRRSGGGQERASPASRRSPSPGVSSVVVREAEIVSPRAEVAAAVAAPCFDAAARGVATSTPMAAPRAVSPAEAAVVSAAAAVGKAWDVSSRGTSTEASASPQLAPQRLADRLDRLNAVTSPADSEPPAAPEESISKPPLPPRITPSQVTRARLCSARHQFLTTTSTASPPAVPQPWGPAPRAVPPPPIPDAAPSGGAAVEVRDAFERFRRQAREDRERLAQSTPDLSLIETTTKQLVRPPSPDPRPRPVETRAWRHEDGYEIDWGESTSTVRPAKGATRAASATSDWPTMAPARRQPESELPCQETDLDAIVRGLQQFIDEISPQREKAKSLLNLEEAEPLSRSSTAADSRAKSMEFLLDDENKATTLPPENQLMRGGEAARQLSRHELRFQRSLRNLNTPDWYRRAAVAPVAAQRRNLDNASLQGGWSGLSSKSNSKESLPATSAAAAPTPLPRRGDWRSFRASRETASVPGTASASPVPLCRRASSGGGRRPGPPPVGTPSAAATPGLRRPYLGWRSQERLTRQGYQTPVERLASSFRGTPGVRRQVPAQERRAGSEGPTRPPPPTDDVRTSIREVTDAIVHYFDPAVQGQNGRKDSPATTTRASREESPSKQRTLWLETAFVGARPVDGSVESTKGGSTVDGLLAPNDARKERFELECHSDGDNCTGHNSASAATCPRLASVTMDDVLDSLLAMQRASPSDETRRRGETVGRLALRARATKSYTAGV